MSESLDRELARRAPGTPESAAEAEECAAVLGRVGHPRAALGVLAASTHLLDPDAFRRAVAAHLPGRVVGVGEIRLLAPGERDDPEDPAVVAVAPSFCGESLVLGLRSGEVVLRERADAAGASDRPLLRLPGAVDGLGVDPARRGLVAVSGMAGRGISGVYIPWPDGSGEKKDILPLRQRGLVSRLGVWVAPGGILLGSPGVAWRFAPDRPKGQPIRGLATACPPCWGTGRGYAAYMRHLDASLPEAWDLSGHPHGRLMVADWLGGVLVRDKPQRSGSVLAIGATGRARVYEDVPPVHDEGTRSDHIYRFPYEALAPGGTAWACRAPVRTDQPSPRGVHLWIPGPAGPGHEHLLDDVDVTAVSFDPGGRELFVGAADGAVYEVALDVDDGALVGPAAHLRAALEDPEDRVAEVLGPA